MTQNDTTPAKRVIRAPEFAKRLLATLEAHPDVPGKHFGQQLWLRDNMAKRQNVDVTKETIRKWVTGEAQPKTDKMKALARLLEVDEAWLAFGVTPDLDFRDREKRNVSLAGAANVLMGFIQLEGNIIAFPGEKDSRKSFVDFYAIIKGAQYAVHTTLAQAIDGGLRFVVPTTYDECTVIGVCRTTPTTCAFLELTSEIISQSKARKGGSIEIEVKAKGDDFFIGKNRLRKIVTFAERI